MVFLLSSCSIMWHALRTYNLYCIFWRDSKIIDFLAQIGPAFISYWTGLNILGPTGTVIVTSPGTWSNLKVPPNQNFQIILNNLEIACRTHLMTLVGTYTSSVVPGVVSPWSGALFQSLP